MRSGRAPIHGAELYFEVHGEPQGRPPLLVLHGGGSTIDTSFGKLIPLLARNRQVIGFDQMGHGRSTMADRPFSFVDTARDAVALLAHLGVGRADVMGYSNGGHIGIELGLRHADAIRKLIIESAMWHREGAVPGFWSFEQARIENMPASLRAAYESVSPHPEKFEQFFDKSVERMRGFAGWTREQIRSIRAPALVLCGDRDMLTPEHAVETLRTLPDARLAILPDTDHMQIVEREIVVPIVERFLDAP